MISNPQVQPLKASSFLRIGERRFPSVDATRASYTRLIPEIEPEPRAGEVAPELEKALWARLPFATLDHASTTEIVEGYVKSLKEIRRFARDVNQLIDAICETSLEFRQESGPTDRAERDKAIQTLREELQDKHRLAFLPTKNVLEADLVSQPEEELRRELTMSLRQSVRHFAKQLFDGLERLVDGKCIGLIDWVSPNVCRYHFFREVIIQENDGVTQVVSGKVRPGSGRSGAPMREMTEVRGGRHIYRHSRHEHHVMHAFRTSIKNSRVVIPQKIQKVIDQIPEWLAPFIQIVDGTLFRERIVEEDYQSDAWQKARTYDEPVVGPEPAVILGPFVLTGWGPREIQVELERREEVSRDVRQTEAGVSLRQNRFMWLLAAATTQVMAVVLMGHLSAANPFLVTPVLLLLILGSGSTWKAIHNHSRVRLLGLRRGRIAACTLSISLLVIAFPLSFRLVSTASTTGLSSLIVLLGSAALLGFLGTRRIRRCEPSDNSHSPS